MNKPIKLWYADTETWTARLVDCPDGGFPNRDIEGNRIYENTHFSSEGKAWRHLQDEAKAGVEIAGRNILNAEKILEKARADAGNAAKALIVFKENRRKAKA